MVERSTGTPLTDVDVTPPAAGGPLGNPPEYTGAGGALPGRPRLRRRRSAKPGRPAPEQSLVLIITAIVTCALVVGPVLVLVLDSVAADSLRPFDPSGITTRNFVTALSSEATATILLNTLMYAAGTVGGGLVVAGSLAWLTERTDLPFRRAIRIGIFAGLPIPALALAFGWTLLLNPNNGTLAQLLRAIPGIDGNPLNVYTLRMMILISVMAAVPTMYLMLCGSIRNMDPQLEAAAAASGASRWTTFFRVTLPLLVPGVFSTLIFMFMVVVQAFEIPLAIGLTARTPTLSTWIYSITRPQTFGQTQYGVAAVFGVVLLGLAAILIVLYFRATRHAHSYHVVTGKAFRPRPVRLGRWRYLALAYVSIFLVLQLLPLLSLTWASLLPFYQAPSPDAFGDVSMDNYVELVNSQTVRDAVINTLLVVFVSATCTMLLATVISWFSIRRRTRASRALEMLAFAPIAIPGIVLALAILLLYVRTPIYNTLWIMVIAYVTMYLAFGSRTMSGALIQIHPQLEQAARTSGVGWSTTMRKILVPLVWAQLVNGWLWILVQSMRDLTIPLMLATANTVLLSSAMWSLWTTEANIPAASALIVVTTGLLVLLAIPVQMYSRNSLTSTM